MLTKINLYKEQSFVSIQVYNNILAISFTRWTIDVADSERTWTIVWLWQGNTIICHFSSKFYDLSDFEPF